MHVPDRIATAPQAIQDANGRNRRPHDRLFARTALPSLTLQVQLKTCSVSHSPHAHSRSDMSRALLSQQLNQIGRSAVHSIHTDSHAPHDLRFPRGVWTSELSLVHFVLYAWSCSCKFV